MTRKLKPPPRVDRPRAVVVDTRSPMQREQDERAVLRAEADRLWEDYEKADAARAAAFEEAELLLRRSSEAFDKFQASQEAADQALEVYQRAEEELRSKHAARILGAPVDLLTAAATLRRRSR